MDREYCSDCFALVAGPSEEWICDAAGKEIEDVDDCPETGDRGLTDLAEVPDEA